MTKPLLSIGIIFKNEIRCLERCLKSLQPLRDALPCELVMADTGSTDGSREIAEQYADILFDFPWINDFAAARNAVMDRCSGEWYMSIDCDEWVDSNIEGYVKFLTTDKEFDFASVIIRNYNTLQLDAGGGYSDFMAVRLARLSTGIRYEGAIHERWHYQGDLRAMQIRNAVFHHDGYVYSGDGKQREKQKRNMLLLRSHLEQNPNDLIALTQCIESGEGLPEQEEYLRRAMAGVDEKWPQWALFGPVIYRYAVRYGVMNDLPELEEWIQTAEDKFPKSIFFRVDTAYFTFGYYWNKDDYAKSIYWGEKYLQGVEDYHAGNFDRADLLASSLYKTDIQSRLNVATVLANGYLIEKQPEKCLRLLESLDGSRMNAKQVGDCVRILCNAHSHYGMDADLLLQRLWNEINEPVPGREQADQRRKAFLQMGEKSFEGALICDEDAAADVIRHAYTAFLPLGDSCELGIAAEMLETEEAPALELLLNSVENLEQLPVQALYHAIGHGILFPTTEKPLNIEQADRLAGRMLQDKGAMLALVLNTKPQPGNRQEAIWARGVALAAVSAFNWKAGGDGVELARAFAQVEQAFLPLCYAPDALRAEHLHILPPMHRFGWYLIQAFEALDAGDAAGYVRLLRLGLERCESAKDMVEFLIDHTPELQAPEPSAELRALAEQIRAVLAKFSPDDPAVAALRQSEAYQKVADLIEGAEVPVLGNLLQ